MYGILPGVKVTTSEPNLQDALSEGYTRKILSGIRLTLVILFRMREHLICYITNTQLLKELQDRRYDVIVGIF
jgi:hypothetical protein